MKHLSTALFIAGSLFLALGIIQFIQIPESYFNNGWMLVSISLYTASIAANLLFNKEVV